VESDDLYTGPTLLAPGSSDTGRNLAKRLLIPLALLFFVILVVFYVLFTSIRVQGESMEPTLRDGDRLLITKGYDTPARGDVVVFATLDTRNREEDLVKRVIAVQGDVVEVRQGIALVNGAVEPTRGLLTSPYDPTYVEPFTVPPGSVYVMGDNRPIALDSRSLGPVPVNSVKGEAVYVYAPIGRARSLR
jgi:signal peptidase I